MDGWILLYKKIWENDLIRGNPYALAVWIWLITHSRDGEVTCGRYQIAKDTGVKPETVRYWTTAFLQQLYMLSTVRTTSKSRTFRICNWDKYQKRTTPSSTADLQQVYSKTTTKKQLRIKNKENILNTLQESMTHRAHFLSLTDLSEFETKFPDKNVRLEHEKAKDYLLSTGKVYKDYLAFFRGWLNRSADKKILRPMLVIGRKP